MTLNDLPELESVLATAIHKLNQVPVAWRSVEAQLAPSGCNFGQTAERYRYIYRYWGVQPLHESLASMAVDAPRLDQEGIYSSILSHYEIEKVRLSW